MIKRNYEMEILINGRSVKEYFHDHKTYIEGRKGSVFSINLRNNSSEKALFIPTVDGLSVMNGKDGSFDSRGYILDAYSSMKIDGWRLSNDEVAEFYFSSVADSYRHRKGKGNSVGSIAVVVFREKEKEHFCWKDNVYPTPYIPWKPDDYPKPWLPLNEPDISPRIYNLRNDSGNYLLDMSTETAAASSMKCYSSQDVGTGFGHTKRSEVISVYFDKENSPDAVLELFYNSREQLSKIGVDFNRRRYSISEPNSFPNESGYCKRPRD